MVQTSTHKWECETFQHISVFAVLFCFVHVHHCVHIVCMCVHMCVHMCVCVWVLLLRRVTENMHIHFILAQFKLLLRGASPTLYSKRTMNDFAGMPYIRCLYMSFLTFNKFVKTCSFGNFVSTMQKAAEIFLVASQFDCQGWMSVYSLACFPSRYLCSKNYIWQTRLYI